MPDQPRDPELSPDQEAEVRRLLAGSRHTEPTPEAVVARLDRVLTGLADEPVREQAVVRLADRRRRAGTMLIAAAAVIVVGVGLGQVLPGGGADSETTTSADSGSSDQAAAPESESESAAGEQSGGGDESGIELDQGQRVPVRVSSKRFARDAERLATSSLAAFASSETDGPSSRPQDSASERSDDRVDGLRSAGRRDVCDPGAWGTGRYIPVVYERAPGWVVLRRPTASSRVVDLFLCGHESAVRSVTLPWP